MTAKHPLAAWREAHEPGPLTQAQLAERLGISRWSVNSIETGRREPSLELAKKIAADTGIPKHLLRPDVWEAA